MARASLLRTLIVDLPRLARSADRDSMRAAAWAWRASRTAARQLHDDGLGGLRLPPPPPLPDSAARGVGAVLRRRGEHCLVSSAVWQRWHLAHDRPLDLVIGVAAQDGDFHAHAWLGESAEGQRFTEISRLPA